MQTVSVEVQDAPAVEHHELPSMCYRSEESINACPECGGKAKVASTRKQFRRMKCESCGHAYKIARHAVGT